jgi:hypothetical protein
MTKRLVSGGGSGRVARRIQCGRVLPEQDLDSGRSASGLIALGAGWLVDLAAYRKGLPGGPRRGAARGWMRVTPLSVI